MCAHQGCTACFTFVMCLWRARPAGLRACVSGSTLRILLEFLLPKDGSLVAFGQYALQFGKALAGLPTFMEVTPEGNSNLLWNPDKDTCEQGQRCWDG